MMATVGRLFDFVRQCWWGFPYFIFFRSILPLFIFQRDIVSGHYAHTYYTLSIYIFTSSIDYFRHFHPTSHTIALFHTRELSYILSYVYVCVCLKRSKAKPNAKPIFTQFLVLSLLAHSLFVLPSSVYFLAFFAVMRKIPFVHYNKRFCNDFRVEAMLDFIGQQEALQYYLLLQ